MTSILNDYPLSELAARLRSAREASGITQAAAASSIDVARTTIVAIEKGQRRIILRELQTLCSLYSTSVNALLHDESPQIDFRVQFRKQKDCASEPADLAATLLSDLVKAELELESLLGVKRTFQNPPEYPLLSGDVTAQAEEDAQRLRHWLGLGQGPIQDIFSLIEFSIGSRLYVRRLPSTISAAFAYNIKAGPCFLLNANHPRTRRVQSAAHELGHFISKREEPNFLPASVTYISREERYADAFARAFLTPARQTIQKFQELTAGCSKLTRRHAILLAHFFGVSREAIIRRLEELKVVKTGTWDWFVAEGGITNEHVRQVLGERAAYDESEANVSNHTELRLNLLASEVSQKGLLSEGQLSRLLHVQHTELRRILDDQVEDNEGGSCDILP